MSHGTRDLAEPDQTHNEPTESARRYHDGIYRQLNAVRTSLGLKEIATTEFHRLAHGLDRRGKRYKAHEDQTAHLEYMLGPLFDDENAHLSIDDIRRVVEEYEDQLARALHNARTAAEAGEYLDAATNYIAVHLPDKANLMLAQMDEHTINSVAQIVRRVRSLIQDQLDARELDPQEPS